MVTTLVWSLVAIRIGTAAIATTLDDVTSARMGAASKIAPVRRILWATIPSMHGPAPTVGSVLRIGARRP
jgi:hypothetical protein